MNYPLSAHLDHTWEKVGRFVYCSCGTRLYQGEVPKDAKQKQEFVEAMDAVIKAALEKYP